MVWSAEGPVLDQGKNAWLLNSLGWTFKVMIFSDADELTREQQQGLKDLTKDHVPVESIFIGKKSQDNGTCLSDVKGLAAQRYGISRAGVYLIRPDQYVAARWAELDIGKIRDAVQCAIGN